MIPWLALAAVFGLIAYLPLLTGAIDHLPLTIPFAAALMCGWCLLGACGAWAAQGKRT